MKKLILIPLLLLEACRAPYVAESIPVVGKVCSVAEATLIDERTAYAAEAVYNVTAQAYVAAINKNQLSTDNKAVLKPKLVAMYSLLKTIRSSLGVANCDYQSMLDLQHEVLTLINRK